MTPQRPKQFSKQELKVLDKNLSHLARTFPIFKSWIEDGGCTIQELVPHTHSHQEQNTTRHHEGKGSHPSNESSKYCLINQTINQSINQIKAQQLKTWTYIPAVVTRVLKMPLNSSRYVTFAS